MPSHSVNDEITDKTDSGYLPSMLTVEVQEVLTMAPHVTAALSTLYRTAGFSIPEGEGHEEAFVKHRFLRFVLIHGTEYRVHAQADLAKARDGIMGLVE